MSPNRQLERCLRRCQRFFDRHEIDARGGWLVGLSGGSDSLALWRVAQDWASQHNQRVEAAVIDHGLRPEAGKEAHRVHRWLRGQGQVCHVLRVGPGDPDQGPEAAARTQRHLALEGIRQQRDLRWLALAHSADDQAETALMRILGGTGLHGLAAMRPVRDHILRPLLWARRKTLEQIAAELTIEPVRDPDNSDPRFLRSRVRHQVLPLIEQIFGDSVPGLCGLAEDAAAAEHLAQQALAGLAEQTRPTGTVSLSRAKLSALPAWLRGQWLLDVLRRQGRPPRRARDTLARFSQLVSGSQIFSLDLRGARVEADAYEVRVILID